MHLESSYYAFKFVYKKYTSRSSRVLFNRTLTKIAQEINKLNAGCFKNILESFAGIKGSKVHQSFEDGFLQYISAYYQNVK